MKPAVGFMLPWAGVTPAPDIKEKMRGCAPVRTFFVPFLSEAKNPGSSFSTQTQAAGDYIASSGKVPPTTSNRDEVPHLS
jgi:hypothetical protein